jgi:hypothetical protein
MQEVRSMIQISLEGDSAIEVAKLLQAYLGEGVSYEVEDPSVVTLGGDQDKVARVLITVKAIVDLAGAGVGVVSDGVDVVQKIQDLQSPKVPSTLIMAGETEVEIENATPEQILEIIRGIEAKGAK